jgi:hypothetical protein
MRNAQHYGMKEKIRKSSQFNDSEYERWSVGITAGLSLTPQWGMKSFLARSEACKPDANGVPNLEVGEK